jgi:hypothetical protein
MGEEKGKSKREEDGGDYLAALCAVRELFRKGFRIARR